MADLFELTELASYMQTDLDLATATLNRSLATTAIRNVVGRTRWATMTAEQTEDLKGIALDVAKRLTLNPDSVRSESIDDYSVTHAVETVGGTDLTESEQARVRRVFGLRGAYSIRPQPPTRCRPTAPGVLS